MMTQTQSDRFPPEPAAALAEEGRWVQASRAGDPRAFDQIVRHHSQRVFNFLFQMTRHREDAEDLAQQTFLKAYRNLHRFDTQRPLINWLLTIARRTALNHFRSRRFWEPVPETAASSDRSPAQAAEARDQAENLWAQARQALPRRQFEILWLRFGEGLSTEETARVVGLTQTHVKVLVFRARRLLVKGEIQL